MEALTNHGNDLWTASFPLRLMGLELGTRTTIVRLGSGGLALISPGPFDERGLTALRGLGEVEAIIAPNTFHHLFARDVSARFPEARLFAAPDLSAKNPALGAGEELGAGPPPLWEGSLEQHLVEGISTNEVVFFHPASRTLILTDLAFNIRRGGLWTRIGMRLNGGFGRFGPTRVVRSAIRDRAAFSRSIEAIARWDFDRIVVAHGDVVESDGRALFREAFSTHLA